jgi:small multidrug resistance pump
MVHTYMYSYTPHVPSILGFAMSLEHIDVGAAYAVWAALGTAVVSIAGMVMFGESCDAIKIACILLIVVGVAGLNIRGEH